LLDIVPPFGAVGNGLTSIIPVQKIADASFKEFTLRGLGRFLKVSDLEVIGEKNVIDDGFEYRALLDLGG
jgi:hypothetical protein